MQILGVILILSGAVLASLLNIGQRWVLKEKYLSPGSFLFLRVGIGCFIIFLFVSFWAGFSSPFQWDSRIFWVAILVSGLINIVIQYASVKASSLAEASLIAPIQALTPGLVTVAAWGLGEEPTVLGLIGILLIAFGTYIHGREGATTLKEYLKPLNFLFLPANYDLLPEKEKENAKNSCRGLRWAYLSAACGTIGLIFDGLISRNGNVVLGIAFKWLLVTSFLFPTLFRLSERGEKNLNQYLRLNNLINRSFVIFVIIGCGVAFAFADLFPAVVFRIAPIAYVGTLKRLNIPLTVLFSWLILNEKRATRRIWPALLVALGAVFLTFDPGIGRIIQEAEKRVMD